MKRFDYDHETIEGMDVDIEISLKEYGFAWIETETDILFYYGIKMDEEEYIKFDFCSVNKDIDIKEEFDWIDWKDIYSFIGATEEEFKNSNLSQQYYDLFQYYGYEEIFGSSYWEGLDYSDIFK